MSKADSKPDIIKLHSGSDAVAVQFPSKVNPGVLRFGDMKPDQPYAVAPAEALRLVTHKGFEYLTPADKKRADDFAAAEKAKAAADAKAADATAEKE